MANIMSFREGERLITQGDKDTAAYLIKSGWLEVQRTRPDGTLVKSVLQAGEIVGELGLAGLSSERTATVVALTDGEVEVITVAHLFAWSTSLEAHWLRFWPRCLPGCKMC